MSKEVFIKEDVIQNEVQEESAVHEEPVHEIPVPNQQYITMEELISFADAIAQDFAMAERRLSSIELMNELSLAIGDVESRLAFEREHKRLITLLDVMVWNNPTISIGNYQSIIDHLRLDRVPEGYLNKHVIPNLKLRLGIAE